MKVIKRIRLSTIDIDRIPIGRKTFNYATLMSRGIKFPPIRVAKKKNGRFKILDGRHRWLANNLNDNEFILAKFSERTLEL
jgi:hypothetical protein